MRKMRLLFFRRPRREGIGYRNIFLFVILNLVQNDKKGDPEIADRDPEINSG